MAAAISAGRSSGAWCPALPQCTISSAATWLAHQAAVASLSSVGEPSKVIISLGTCGLSASHASYAWIRDTSPAGSPPSGICLAQASSGRRLARVG
jgi:hypothetical protein